MKSLRFIMPLLVVLSGCSDNGTVLINVGGENGECSDACNVGERECIDDATVRICSLDAEGCAVFETKKCKGDKVCTDGACKSESGEVLCEDACDASERECISDSELRKCVLNDDDCYEYRTEPCADGKICQGGKCVGESISCENKCNADEKKCISDRDLAVCVLNDDGCYVLESSTCDGNKVCRNNECVDDGQSCTDECTAGSKSCSDDGKTMVCGNFDDDACLELLITSCNENEHCNNGICEDNGTEPDPCKDECSSSGASECVGTGSIRTCGNYDDDACLEWSDAKNCPSGLSCQNNKCSCTNQCDKNGSTQCDSASNGFKTCTDTNGDGCLEWTSVTPCNDMKCSSGACVCSHACDANAKECSGNGFRTCTTNAQGCRVWSSVTACSNGCTSGACNAADVMKPTRYPGNQILSPVTAYSVQQMKAIAAKKSRKDLHFAKLGDSHFAPGTVFMYCFSSNKTHNLNGATFLENVIKAYQSDGTNSFSRDSVSAVIGWTVWKAVSSGKLAEELSAMNPRFAFIDYGSNDIGWYDYVRPTGSSGEGYFATLQWFYREYRKALDLMIPTGVIPLIIGTGIQKVTSYGGRTLGDLNPINFVPVFNAVSRGLAEQYQIPYMDLALLQSQEPLKSNNYGLSGDNLHHTSTNGGCDFTSTGMKYGANARNRYAIEMLDRAWKTVIQDEKAPDQPVVYEGAGTKTSPYSFKDLPYTHAGNTSKGTNNFSAYGCSSSTSEGGPEIYYKYTTTSSKKIRAFVVSAANVDADIHLKKTLDDNSCMARGDKWVEANLPAGTYYFVIDTYASSSNAGEYLFGIVECNAGDGLCGSATVGG